MISFIMPYIGDREEQLKATLASLEAQSIKDYEVILVCHSDTNPATAFNWGVELAKGEIICLTSPEVFNARNNVMYMQLIPQGEYWVGEVYEVEREPMGCWDKACLKNVPRITVGVYASCNEQDWAPWKYFLGVLHKDEYHEMDEYYTDGIAFEDRDWADRLKLKASFNPNIMGLHLTHSRLYQHNGQELRDRNREHYNGNQTKNNKY